MASGGHWGSAAGGGLPWGRRCRIVPAAGAAGGRRGAADERKRRVGALGGPAALGMTVESMGVLTTDTTSG